MRWFYLIFFLYDSFNLDSREKLFSFVTISSRLIANIRDVIKKNIWREIFLSCDVYKNRTADMCKVGECWKWVWYRQNPDKIAHFVDTRSLTQSVFRWRKRRDFWYSLRVFARAIYRWDLGWDLINGSW